MTGHSFYIICMNRYAKRWIENLHTALICLQFQSLVSQQLLEQEAVQQVWRRESRSSLLSFTSCSWDLLLQNTARAAAMPQLRKRSHCTCRACRGWRKQEASIKGKEEQPWAYPFHHQRPWAEREETVLGVLDNKEREVAAKAALRDMLVEGVETEVNV